LDLLADFLVGHPDRILGIAAAFGAAAWLFRRRALWLPAVAWGLYGIWEAAVVAITPEANIRVDLMLIWPALLILMLVSGIRALRAR